ncbi:hypothetical protein D3C81_1892400 [compost metagenome]
MHAHGVDQVIFDAAARDGTDHRAIVADGQGGAHGAGAGTPRLDDGDEFAAVAGGQPGGAGFQNFKVDAVHGARKESRR